VLQKVGIRSIEQLSQERDEVLLELLALRSKVAKLPAT
jgi:hypothetical protein